MKKFKRAIAALLVMITVLQPAAFAASVADFLDFPFGWSKDAMTAAVENGLYIGNESKLIQPGKALTRAELAAFITRAFGATRTADISRLTDVSADDWFYLPVAKAYQMGAITGTSDTTFDPSAYITREQVFLVLARVLCISGTDESVLNKFTDASAISSWAKNGVIGMVEKGYVNGYPDGSFKPQENITREELAQVFHNIFKMYIDAPGYYSQVPETGSVMIRVPGVHLENVTVNGDVVIADGVANGDFDLASVNVNGRVLARGGEGKVTFKSVTVGEKVVIYDLNGTVNFNNYRTDAPFKNLDEITPATFLKKPETTTGGSTGGGGGGGGSVTYYTVTLRDDDDSVIGTDTVRSGKTMNEPADPTKAHYTFMHWSREKNGTAFDFENTKITGNMSLYAVYKKNPVISFEVDGTPWGTAQEIPYNAKATEPDPAPTKEGHTFSHWVLAADGSRVFFGEKRFTQDATLKAVFTVNQYDVVFYAEEYDATNPNPAVWQTLTNQTYGSEIAKPTGNPASPDPAKKFAGWKLKDATDFLTFPYTVGVENKIYPVFSDKTAYTVTFKADGATDVVKTVYEGDKVTPPADPTKTGYTFKHWSETTDGPAFDFNTAITDNTTLYAVFQKNTYIVKFLNADGSEFHSETVEYEGSVAKPATNPTAPTGKTFSHWVLEGTTAEVTFPYTVTGDTTFEPVFTADDVFTVTFIVDGSTYKTLSVIDGNAIGASYPADPTKEHYSFEGWYTGENGTGTKVDAATAITSDLTVYAYFKATLLTVSFYNINDWSNGDDPLVKVIQIPYGVSLNELMADDPTVTVPANTSFAGFKRNASVASIYATLGIDDTHTVDGAWYYIDGGKWQPLDLDAAITENTIVFDNYKEARLIVSIPRLSSIPLTLYAPYNSETRVIDTFKDALFNSETTIKTALNGEAGDKLLEQMVRFGVIDNVTDRNILNQHRFIKLVNVIGRSNIEKMIGSVVDDSISSDDSKQYIYEYIEDYMDKIEADKDKAVTVLTPAFNDILAGSSAASFRAVLQSVVDEVYTPGTVTVGDSVDQAMVRQIVEYIADDTHKTTRDTLTDAIFASVDGDTLIQIAADLGQTEATSKVNAVNQLIDELCDASNTKVTVTADRLFMFEPIYKMLKDHGWSFFEAKIPERAKALLPLADIKVLFDRHYDAYVGDMKAAMDAAEADPTATFTIENGVQVDINPISDILTPMLTYVKDMKAYAEGKAPTITNATFVKYYPYYLNNPYKDAYEEFLVTDKWVSGSDNGYTGKLSGYKFYSFDKYYDILKSLTVVLDDTLSWYYDDANVAPADREDVFAVAEDKVLAVANMLNRFLVDYAVNGIPDNLKDLCLDIENDPTMIEIIKKFGVEKYLEKLEDNATAGKVYETAYDKFNARFGARLEVLLDRFYHSKLNRYYDDAEYQKGKEILHGLFTTDTDAYTVDTIFADYFGGAEAKDFEYNGITVEIIRQIFYSTTLAEEMKTDLGI